MLRKILFTPWFGPKPVWMQQYWDTAGAMLKGKGYEFATVSDLDLFKDVVEDVLEMEAPIEEGKAKVHDYRPAFGMLMQHPLFDLDCDYWGWCDFDIVWGRLDRFWPDELISGYELVSDCASYVGGPFTLLKNSTKMRCLFMEAEGWHDRLTEEHVSGWGEKSFSRAVEQHCTYLYKLQHAYEQPQLLRRHEDGALWHDEREVSFYHFRRTKEWPCTALK